MDREIKFRAWDAYQKKMYSWSKLGRLNRENSLSLWNCLIQVVKHIIPMQYTGRNDKNGIEVYSDDIVKAWTKDGATIIGKVVIESDETVIETTDHQWLVASFTVLDRLEVIGNIYENPELVGE